MRHNIPVALGAIVLAFASVAHAAAPDVFNDLLESSMKDKKGVMVYVKGQAIGGRVTRITAEAIEMTGREYARIVIRRDAIDAVAGN
ncbi:MAG TPA: hypothetical protein VHA82_11965 [Ramlibacter sp.]|uniref:hypothetical protein n=1 Tax=Ramlibacter sp. TaxID=1917967 RepID=UPI002C56D3CB|nr:hypothetical protein [Ramlibacter sp.]HVZ44517.1 hypothetical protein [Ramlibacter sp.]